MPPHDNSTKTIDQSLEEVRYKDREGYPYIIHQLMDGVPRVNPEMLREFVAWAKRQNIMDNATVFLAPEAMGIPLAVALSLATDIPYVVARKREYGLPGELISYCETGYSSHCIYLNDIKDTDCVVIVDDVISTGGTLTSIINSVKDLGARVEGVLCPISKGDGAEKVRAATQVPVAVLKQITFNHDNTITVE
jgi:adenine phosphoribosyltransferase